MLVREEEKTFLEAIRFSNMEREDYWNTRWDASAFEQTLESSNDSDEKSGNLIETCLKRHFWSVDEKLWVLSSGLKKVSNEIQWTIRWYETVSFVRISFSLFFFLSTKEETRKRTREFMNVNSDFISADIVGSEFRIPRRRKFVNGVICSARGET